MQKRNATVAVIGAGDYIGAEIAKKFAAEGFTVFVGRRQGEKLAPLVKETRGRIARVADASGNLDLPRIVPVRSTVTMGGADWIGIHQTEATVLTGINRIPLFYGFVGLFGVAGLFGLLALDGLPFATWVREGR